MLISLPAPLGNPPLEDQERGGVRLHIPLGGRVLEVSVPDGDTATVRLGALYQPVNGMVGYEAEVCTDGGMWTWSWTPGGVYTGVADDEEDEEEEGEDEEGEEEEEEEEEEEGEDEEGEE
jgi:hypothetical protein